MKAGKFILEATEKEVENFEISGDIPILIGGLVTVMLEDESIANLIVGAVEVYKDVSSNSESNEER